MKQALEWLRRRGGECAIARTTAGGRIYLAQGDVGPFTPGTVRRLVRDGLAEFVDVGARKNARLRLIEGTAAQPPATMADSTIDGSGYVA